MAPSLDGRLPYMEVKVFYVLYDMTESDCGNLWLVPGSHRRRPDGTAGPGITGRIRLGAVELKLPIGSGRVVAHRGVALRRPQPLAEDAEDHARGIPLPLASADRFTTSRIPDSSKEARPSGGSCWAPFPRRATPWDRTRDYHPASRHWMSEDKDDVPLREWAERIAEG